MFYFFYMSGKKAFYLILHMWFARSLLKDDATFSGILLFSGRRPVAVLFLEKDGWASFGWDLAPL